MSALAVTSTPIRPTARGPHGPDCSRPRSVMARGASAQVASCRVERRPSEPAVRLTHRGMVAAMSVVGVVMGSATVTLVTAFLSVGNGPF